MWTRKGLKQKAKIAVKRSYWKTVLAAFLFSLLAGGGSGGVNIRIQLHMPLQTPEQTRAIIYSLAEVPGMVWAFFGLFAFILFAVSICIKLLLINPLTLGIYKYASDALNNSGNLSNLGKGFEKSYKRNVYVMFLRDFCTVLWSLLLIIPGIVKSYEYRMIPYLLADHPEMSKDEAFAASKAMMDGNKWKAFVLDLSFILWNLLNIFTIGLLGLFWVAPYTMLTGAALYDALQTDKPEAAAETPTEAQPTAIEPAAAEPINPDSAADTGSNPSDMH